MSDQSPEEQPPRENAPDTVAQQHAELKAAAHEMQRYLSDDIAPLTAAEFFEELLPGSPEIAARLIAEWVSGQLSRPGEHALASDLVYHSLRKLYLLAEFELLPREPMLKYIQGASKYLIQACPVAERDDLKLRLSRLGEGETGTVSGRARYIHTSGEGEGASGGGGGGVSSALGAVAAAASKFAPVVGDAKPGPVKSSQLGQVGSGPPPALPTAQQIERGTMALSLLLDRLSQVKLPEKLADTPEVGSFAQLLTTAALDAKSETELGKNMEKVRGTGNAAPMGQVFRALGWNLPGWTAVGEKGEVVAPAGRSLEAMNRIVALAPDSQEKAKRWGEMIYAAIEQLNEGRLAQAVSILEAAKVLIAEKHPDPTIVGQVLSQAEGAISEPVIRKLVDIPGKHALLRLVLDFFPGMRATALLDELDGEPRRERRKLILALLECHGQSCRDAILDRLRAITGGEKPDLEGYFGRNLAFLLRRIPRRGHERIEEEMALLEKMIGKGQPPMSAKEAIGALGQMRERTAECALLDRLHDMESELSRGGNQDDWELLDRICAALARHGSKQSIRAVAAHAFKRHNAFGDTMARLENLGWVDLSIDPEQLAILLKTIRDLMPKKLLGLSMSRPPSDLAPLVHAVSGTPTMEVRSVLETIASTLKNHPVGEQAQKALAKLAPRAGAPAAASVEALTGDLELFGLAGLLQSLQGSESTGELTIVDKQQGAVGMMGLSKGRITKCEAGRLTGVEAAYLLFEKPVPGNFTFRTTSAAQAPRGKSNEVIDPMQVILEGARRHDEYKRAVVIAPDGLRLEPAGISAVRPEDEESADLASDVWERAAKGLTPEACEHEIAIDPFRVRRLYAWWIEQGALRARTS